MTANTLIEFHYTYKSGQDNKKNLFYVPQKKESHTGFEQYEAEVEYPFLVNCFFKMLQLTLVTESNKLS